MPLFFGHEGGDEVTLVACAPGILTLQTQVEAREGNERFVS